MSIKRWDGVNQVDVASIKRFDGSNWVDVNSVKRFDGSNWVETWNSKVKFKVDSTSNLKSYSITKISDNRIQLQITGGSTAGYIVFRCSDIVASAGMYTVHNYTLKGIGSNRSLAIGISALPGNLGGITSTMTGTYNTDTPVSVNFSNNNNYIHNPIFKFEVNASTINTIEIQIDSIVADKTYYPVFDV